MTWREYEKILPQRVAELHRLIHARFFNALSVTAEDLERPRRTRAFALQERSLASAPSAAGAATSLASAQARSMSLATMSRDV